MVKSIVAFVFFILSTVAFSQSNFGNSEDVKALHSLFIDYEIYHDKVVAITKEKRDYYIHFTNSKGEEVSELLEIRNPEDLHIDAKGDLYVIGLGQAIQIRITDKVELVQTFERVWYNANIKNRVAYFDKTFVREVSKTALSFELLSDSSNSENFALTEISITVTDEETEEVDEIEEESQFKNEGHSMPLPAGLKKSKKIEEHDQLVAFKSGDSLWVFVVNENILGSYNQYGEGGKFSSFRPEGLNYSIDQDKSTGDIYINSFYSGTYTIERVDRLGIVETVFSSRKSSFISELKIANGYLYYIETLSTTSSIKRVKLN